ncbi:MAG: hypothetical protein AMJ78_06755 [Omnitrophica WOR_2 bacterium SM23_29]|nr:MAG: hypothetical protein AMJ78_06755 [Omnitrophica WOR_2 bacterium SM23_29]
MIYENLMHVRQRIGEAAGRGGRNGDEIVLVCVTKGVGITQIEEAVKAGVTDIGENYIQDAVKKFNAIGRKVKWHFIGHLQTNKVKDAVYIFDLIHSVDSLKLAQEISRQASKLGIIKDVLIEVKTSEEATKYGILPAGVSNLIEEVSTLPNLRVMGLMTMAPIVDTPEKARPYFRRLKELSQAIATKKIENVRMQWLSMGMTQDFEVAIEESANMVRIGRAIFEG